METRSRGVLDRPVKPGDDSYACGYADDIVIARSEREAIHLPRGERWIASLRSQ